MPPELAIDGRFELGERVGKGAFGEVLRAVDRLTGRPVAVKRLLEHRDDPLVIERFEREAELVRSLDSPYIVGYVAHGADARGRPCIALEWLEGADLAQILRAGRGGGARGGLTTSEAIEIVRQAALGLHVLHERGIVHRDVKPANFFVLSEEAIAGDPRSALAAPCGGPPRVKLIDLGVARLPAEDTLAVLGGQLGTPRYMSPEQVRGEPRITAASDIFSLGLVLYELLAGTRPFTGGDEIVVLAQILLHEPPPLAEQRPDLPPLLGQIAARAMAKEPAARFPSARALAEALAAAAELDLSAARRAPSSRAGPDEAPSAAPSTSLSTTREQRALAAVFAGFAGAAEPAADQALDGGDLDAAVASARLSAARGAQGTTLGLLRLVQAQACRWRGDTDEAIRCGVEAAALLPRGDRPWFRAVAEIVAACGRRSEWPEVERWLGEAAAAAAAPWARSDQIACLCPGAAQLLQAGRDGVAEAIAARARHLARESDRVEPFALARLAQLRALRAFRGGCLEAARSEYLEAIALFEAAGDQRNACLERINLGVVCAELGELERAEEVLRLCLAGAERMRLGVVRGYALVNLSRVLLDQGRIDEAADAAEQARAVGLANDSPRLAGAALTRLSMLAHRRGDLARAEADARLAEEALAGSPPLRAGALAARARALVAQGRAAEALEAARRAMALIEDGHYEIFHPLIRLAHAEALDAVGEPS